MIKELCAVATAVITFNGNNQRNYQHTDNIGYNIGVTYKYDTNEVNSVSDLVKGNIYDIDLSNFEWSSGLIRFTNAYRVIATRYTTCDISLDLTEGYLNLFSNNNSYIGLVYSKGGVESYYQLDKTIISFVYMDSFNVSYIDLVSSSSYNEIVSAEYIQPRTFIGVINNFCEEYVFAEIPFANDMIFTVGGQQVNLLTYLVMLVGIALGIGLIILLIMFFKWLFLLFAGLFKTH